MRPAKLIERTAAARAQLASSDSGSITPKGNQWVIYFWLPVIKKIK